MRGRLLGALALYLTEPLRHAVGSTPGEAQSLHAVLRPGDVLLSDANSRMAALVRRVTRSSWSHVSMYVGPLEDGPDPRCIVEADLAAGVRAVPLSSFEGQRARVLRPVGLGEAERHRIADWVVRFENGYYQLERQSQRAPVRSKVEVKRYLNGELHFYYRGREVGYQQLAERPAKRMLAPATGPVRPFTVRRARKVKRVAFGRKT